MVRVLASHQCGPGSNPGIDAICGLSLLLVLSFAPRGFSPGTPVFPSPQKPTLPNSNSIWNEQTRLTSSYELVSASWVKKQFNFYKCVTVQCIKAKTNQPGSMGHSLRDASSAGLFPVKTQLELRSIIGILYEGKKLHHYHQLKNFTNHQF